MNSRGKSKHIIATGREWHSVMAKRLEKRLGEPFAIINNKEELTREMLEKYKPGYIFFPHWSYMIPEAVYGEYECVVFHMTDLPFGRGGSPLQNLISRGIYETQISAFRCVKELDAGPIYMKRPLLLHGSAEQIYMRAGEIVEDMIVEIIRENPSPKEQTGEPVVFKRRKPAESVINGIESLSKLYDHIRMLDAEGYPGAFLEIGNFRYEFHRASLKNGKINADVEITAVQDEQ